MLYDLNLTHLSACAWSPLLIAMFYWQISNRTLVYTVPVPPLKAIISFLGLFSLSTRFMTFEGRDGLRAQCSFVRTIVKSISNRLETVPGAYGRATRWTDADDGACDVS